MKTTIKDYLQLMFMDGILIGFIALLIYSTFDANGTHWSSVFFSTLYVSIGLFGLVHLNRI